MNSGSYDLKLYDLKLLGTFGFTAPCGARVHISSKKAIALIAMLAMSDDGWRTRVWLQDMLWSSRGLRQAQASLRRELSNLRKMLGDAEHLLLVEFDKVGLDLSKVTIDARRDKSSALSNRLPGLVPSDFLEGLDIADADGFNDWLRAQRSRLLLSTPANDPSPEAMGAPPNDVVMPLRPSIAVLPFDDLSQRRDHRHLADGVSEEIYVSLSRYSTLLVVWAGFGERRGQTNMLSGAVVRTLCAELGVRYLLAGSIQPSGGRLRVRVRLMDGVGDAPVWTSQYEDKVEDLFSLQDKVAQAVAPQVDSSIEKNERRRAIARPVQSADAAQLYWRANAAFRTWTRAGFLEAIDLTEQVLEREPTNGWAAALSAFCNAFVFSFGWSNKPCDNRAAALARYKEALQYAPDDPFVLGYAAGTQLGVGGDVKTADQLIARALEIHPNCASTLFWGGWVDVANRKISRALERFEDALRLNPRSAVRPFSMTGMGLCLLAQSNAEDALTRLEEAVQFLPNYHIAIAGLIAAHEKLGRTREAMEFAERLLAIGSYERVLPFFSQQDQSLIVKLVETALTGKKQESG